MVISFYLPGIEVWLQCQGTLLERQMPTRNNFSIILLQIKDSKKASES